MESYEELRIVELQRKLLNLARDSTVRYDGRREPQISPMRIKMKMKENEIK